jgi:sensor domain CHASE-containing protein
LVIVNDGPGCFETLLVALSGVIFFSIVGGKLLAIALPYLPIAIFLLVLIAIVCLVRKPLMTGFARWQQRRDVERQARQAEAEIHAIHRETVRQMNRVLRRSRG